MSPTTWPREHVLKSPTREHVLTDNMRLKSYTRAVHEAGPMTLMVISVVAIAVCVCAVRFRHLSPARRSVAVTLFYSVLYFVASPTAILVNKILMKDLGFHYPVMVSSLGQATTAVLAAVSVQLKLAPRDAGRRVKLSTYVLLGAASALAMVLGQYPYLYLTVAFIQMLKSFSPAYMVILLYCLRIERPSQRTVGIVCGLCLSAAMASAGEVNFNLIGILFMVSASISDALRLVLSQWLLKNLKLNPIEALYYTSPVTCLWLAAALMFELPAIRREQGFRIAYAHPVMFIASGVSGFFVNITGSLLVKRTSSMTLKTMTMTRNAGLILFSALCMGETITMLEAAGYTLLLFFFVLFSFSPKARVWVCGCVGV